MSKQIDKNDGSHGTMLSNNDMVLIEVSRYPRYYPSFQMSVLEQKRTVEDLNTVVDTATSHPHCHSEQMPDTWLDYDL